MKSRNRGSELMSLRDSLNKNEVNQLFKALLSLKTEDDCDALLEDLCTLSEIKAISQRLEVAKRLHLGENYTEIAKNTGASSATVSRVNKCLNYGAGGYRKVMEVIAEGEKKHGKK